MRAGGRTLLCSICEEGGARFFQRGDGLFRRGKDLLDTLIRCRLYMKAAAGRNRHPELEGTVQCIQAFNELVATTVKGFRATYSDIFIDTAGRDSADLRRSWGMADDVLIPMSLSLFDLEHIADLHETYLRMQEFNPDANVSIILRPQTNPRREELQRAYDEIAEKTSIPIANVHFPERRIHYRATDKGWSSEEIGGTADETKRTDPGVTDMLNIYGYLYG